MAVKKKPITQSDKVRIVVDAIVIAHFVVGNFCIIAGAFTKLFEPFKTSTSLKANSGIDFLYGVMDAPVVWFLNKFLSFYYFILGFLQKSVKTLATVEAGSFFYYLLAESVVLMGSAFYGVFAYLLLRGITKVSNE